MRAQRNARPHSVLPICVGLAAGFASIGHANAASLETPGDEQIAFHSNLSGNLLGQFVHAYDLP